MNLALISTVQTSTGHGQVASGRGERAGSEIQSCTDLPPPGNLAIIILSKLSLFEQGTVRLFLS